jgi:uncharacterized membrane protein YvlD (DUF360 family)
MAITLLILIVLEVFSTAVLPVFGLTKFRIPFNILIILFFGFKLQSAHTAVLILVTQYVHSFFSVEGWEMGTIAGVVVCLVISYLKDLIHLTSSAVTILVTQLFQILWFAIVAAFIYFKLGSYVYVLEKFWRFLPESLAVSFLAPFFFSLLDRIWRMGGGGVLGDEY